MDLQGKRLLIDGYNVIRRTPRWNELFHRDMATARNALVGHCAGLKARHRGIDGIVIFFEGDSSVSPLRSHRPHGIRVVFTPSGVEADDRIIREVRNGTPADTVVVSDDREVAGRCRALGATILPAARLAQGTLTSPRKPGRRPGSGSGKADLTPDQKREINDELREMFGID